MSIITRDAYLRDEPAQKNFLSRELSADFQILSEVRGNNLLNQDRKVILDFLLKPKKHLVKIGFADAWFGIEAKHFPNPGDSGKFGKALWQSITYQQSSFPVEETVVRPYFVLLYSNYFQVNKDDDWDRLGLGMVRLAFHAKVGLFQFTAPGWKINFSCGNIYFSKNGSNFKKGKFNIDKTKIGNVS